MTTPSSASIFAAATAVAAAGAAATASSVSTSTTSTDSSTTMLLMMTSIIAVATTTALSLIILPSDYINRNVFVLFTKITSSQQLQMKRIISYQYQWNQALIQQIRIFYNRKYNNNDTNQQQQQKGYTPSTATTSIMKSLTSDGAKSAIDIELLISRNEIEEFVHRIIKPSEHDDSTMMMYELRIAHIGRDNECMNIPKEPSSSSSSSTSSSSNSMFDHYFVWFHYYTDNNNNNNKHRVLQCIQVPLLLFGQVYTKVYETSSNIRTTTFCFIYDTTQQSYYCNNIILPLVSTITKLIYNHHPTLDDNDSNKKLPLNCYPNPTWMVQLAILLLSSQQQQQEQGQQQEQEKDESYEQQLRQCLYTFCMIEAYSLSEQIIKQSKNSNNNNTNNNTMIYTISTSIIPIMLPILHDIFPDDRHVFVYTGCIQSFLQFNNNNSKNHSQSKNNNKSLNDYTFHSDDVMYTKPIYMNNTNTVHSSTTSDMLLSSHIRMKSYYDAMTHVPIHIASHIETWMDAVHTLLVRQHQKGISFLPYICKIDYLLPSLRDIATLSSTTTTSPVITTDDTINMRWSIRSLLQYMTGNKSREIPNETLDAAYNYCFEQNTYIHDIASLSKKSNNNISYTSLRQYQKAIENIIFQHKLILLPNKTFVDTVQPNEHWTLKQAAKLGGCSCCGIDEDEDDDEEEKNTIQMGNDGVTTTLSPFDGPKSNNNKNSSSKNTNFGYVDGKTKFAFDPTQFT